MRLIPVKQPSIFKSLHTLFVCFFALNYEYIQTSHRIISQKVIIKCLILQHISNFKAIKCLKMNNFWKKTKKKLSPGELSLINI